MDQQLWGEMLDVLKDIGGYLTKQDAEQTRAKVSKVPKISDNQADMPLVGGDSPNGKPGSGVAKSMRKSMVQDTRERTVNEAGDEEIKSEGDSVLNGMDSFANADEDMGLESGAFGGDEDEGMEEEAEEGGMGEEGGAEETPVSEANDAGTLDAIIAAAEAKKAELEGGAGQPDMGSIQEMKSLLKDIRSSLIANSKAPAAPVIAQEIKKSIQPLIREETQRMMRKMGFRPSRADVTRFGIEEDTNALRKSADERQVDKVKDLEKTLDNLSGKSWQELGQMREGMGQFNPFRQ